MTVSPQPISPGDDAVLTFLRERFGEGVSEVTRLGAGAWSTAFAFRHGGEARVVRFGALREDFERDAVASAYRAPELPIPRVLALGEAFGGYFCVSERAFGEYLDDLDGARMRAVLPSLVAALDAARAVDLAGTSGYGNWNAERIAPYPSWKAMLLDVDQDRPGDRTSGWRPNLARSPLAVEAFAAGYARLQSLVNTCPEARSLIHSDLLNFNVLVAGERISAVFDWGCALYGDFLYDIAWFVFWAPWYPAWHGIDFAAEAKRHYAAIELAVPTFDERLRCYCLHIGLASLAYNAFTQRWTELDRVARRVEALSRQPSAITGSCSRDTDCRYR